MLRRTLAISLLLAAVAAFPAERSTSPPVMAVTAALPTPSVAIAQATASASDQTVADNSQGQPAVASVDTQARAAPVEKAGHSRAILLGALFAIAALIAAAWHFSKRGSGDSDSGGYGGYAGGSGSSSGPSGGTGTRPQRPQQT